MGKKKAGVILFVILIAAVAAIGIWYYFDNDGKDSNDRVYVEKVSVIRGGATGIQNRYSGVVQPQKTVEVKADSDRTIGEVYVQVGDTVEEGTPLFNYDTEDAKIELEQEKLELDNQDIEINNFRNQIRELEKERQAAAEANKFEYTTQIQTIETNIKKAEFEKSSKQLEIDKLQKRVDNSEVVSTASGVVKTINNGENSEMGETSSSAFMTILSTGEYRIQGMVNEQNIGMISVGSQVIIRSRVDEEITWSGTIDTIDTGEASSSSEDEYYESDSDSSASSSSKYPFYVALDSAEGLMLGQHVLIELDEGQMEEKEGIWLFSSYIVREGQENGMDLLPESDDWMNSTEFLDATEYMDSSDLFDFTESTELEGSTELTEGASSAYVWADDGNGRLEKRMVELGEYDAMLDEYEILSGLTEDDLIAWPMEGLYEGVRTVTDMDEVDYSSGLYNQEMGTETMIEGSEMDMLPEEGYMDDDYNMDSDYDMDDDYDEGDYESDGSDEDMITNDNSALDSLMNEGADKDDSLLDMGVPE